MKRMVMVMVMMMRNLEWLESNEGCSRVRMNQVTQMKYQILI